MKPMRWNRALAAGRGALPTIRCALTANAVVGMCTVQAGRPGRAIDIRTVDHHPLVACRSLSARRVKVYAVGVTRVTQVAPASHRQHPENLS